jgi:sugar phosphate isomerase/epimerase
LRDRDVAVRQEFGLPAAPLLNCFEDALVVTVQVLSTVCSHRPQSSAHWQVLPRGIAGSALPGLSAEKMDLMLVLENMNWEPDDAEVHYLAHNVDETRYYVDRIDSPHLRWALTANRAHIVEDGVDAFLDDFEIRRCDEVRLADCWRNGQEEHLLPGQGDFDSHGVFAKLKQREFAGHYMNALGTRQDMLEGRERPGAD